MVFLWFSYGFPMGIPLHASSDQATLLVSLQFIGHLFQLFQALTVAPQQLFHLTARNVRHVVTVIFIGDLLGKKMAGADEWSARSPES